MSGNPIANAQGDNLLYGGEVDPRVNPINMPANAVYIYAPPSGAGALLRKQDGGVTSNFDTLVTDAMARDFSNAQPAANAIDMNSNLINNVLDPVAAQDAATKNYVDTAIGAIDLSTLKLLDNTDRFVNGTFIKFRNNADNADLDVLGVLGDGMIIGGGSISDITMGAAGQISFSTDANIVFTGNSSQVQFNNYASISMNNAPVVNVADPSNAQDAATKNYVDTQIGAIPSGMATDFSNAVASAVNLDLNNNSLINVNTIDNNSFNDLTLKADSAWVVVNAGGGLKPLTDGNRALGDLSQRWSQGAFSNSVLVGAPALRTNYNSSSMAVTGTNYTFSQTPGFGFNFNVSTGNINFSSTTGNVDFTGVGGVVDFTGVTVNGLPAGGDAWSDPVDSNIAPAGANDGIFNIGASGQEFNQIHTRQIMNTGDGTVALDMNTSDRITVSRNIYPDGGGTRNLGFNTGGREWSLVASRLYYAIDPTGTNNLRNMFLGIDSSFDGLQLTIYKPMPSGYIPAGYAGEAGNSREGFGVGTEPQFSNEPSGPLHLETGNTVNGISGQIFIQSGTPTATGTSGPVNIKSGSHADVTNANKTGDINLISGNNAGTGNSGDINIASGTVNSGTRGKIKLDALMATLPTGTTDPTGVDNGDAYYNTSSNQLRVYNGGTWRGITLT